MSPISHCNHFQATELCKGRSFATIALPLVLLLALGACGDFFGPTPTKSPSQKEATEKTYKLSKKRPPAPPIIPRTLSITIEIFDYRIVSHRIDTDLGPIQKLRVRPTPYTDGNNVLIRIDPVPTNEFDFYYLATLPNIQDGRTTIVARKIDEPIAIDELYPPPDEISITLIIRDNAVVSNKIDSYSEKTYGLYLKNVRKRGNRKIVVLESRIYDGVAWEFLLPKANGDFRVKAKKVR